MELVTRQETDRVSRSAKSTLALELLRRRTAPSAAELSAAGFPDMAAVVQRVADQFRVGRLPLDEIELAPSLGQIVQRSWAERHRVVPVFDHGDEVTIATCDPTKIEVFDWLRVELRKEIVTVLAAPDEIERALRRLYEVGIEPARVESAAEPSAQALAEATQVVDSIVLRAVELKASDIHLEAGEHESVLRYRIDGALRVIETHSRELHAAMVSRIKVLAQLDISERYAPQDGRIKLKLPGKTVDLRVSVLPTYFGEKVCCRILDNSRASLPLSALGFEERELAIFQRLIRAPYGMLLVTGPTGSGKSTTLYAALNTVRSPELNIVSVEDPVEYQLPGINQVQVNPRRGMTFAGALRSILRQDPNVILVGEIRDRETGTIAIEAALTGHLVMASLHTNDAVGAITRLTEMGIEPYLVAPALVGVVAQRLLRRVCEACRNPYRPGDEELEALGLEAVPAGTSFMRGEGCDSCQFTGYRGRIAVRELLEVNDALKAAIGRSATADELKRVALTGGFRTMRFQGMKLLVSGVTTASEVIRLTRG